MTEVRRVSQGAETSPIVKVSGQRSRWKYGDERKPPQSTDRLININLSNAGIAATRLGRTKYNSTSLAEAGIGLIQQEFADGTDMRLVCTLTKVYYDDGTTRTDVTGAAVTLGSLTKEDRIRYAYIDDTIYATSGLGEVWKKNATITSPAGDITELFPSGHSSPIEFEACKDLVAHGGVLVALHTKESSTWYPTRIRWSDVDRRTFVPDPDTWAENNRFEVAGGGAAILGGVDNFSTLFIFKEDGIYPGRIAYDTGFIEFRLDDRNVMRGIQPIARSSFLAHPDFVWGIARSGAFVVVPSEAGFEYRFVTHDVQDQWKDLLNAGRLQYAVSYLREADKQVRTLLSSSTNSSGHDLELVWSWETGDVWFDDLNDQINVAAPIEVSNVEYDWMVSETDYVYLANTTDDDDGTAIDWEIRMAPNDLGFPNREKKLLNFRTLYSTRTDVVQGTTCTLDLIRNQGALPTVTKTVAVDTVYLWDTQGLAWDSGLNWPAESPAEATNLINRTAELVSPRWTGSTPQAIIGYIVEFIPLEAILIGVALKALYEAQNALLALV